MQRRLRVITLQGAKETFFEASLVLTLEPKWKSHSFFCLPHYWECEFFYILQKNSFVMSLCLYVCMSFHLYVFMSVFTRIYELILIKVYMNSNIINTQIFYFIKYELNGYWRSLNLTFMFILTFTYFLMNNFLSLFCNYYCNC